jgi:dTDP-4-dehydrorhamnose reductase
MLGHVLVRGLAVRHVVTGTVRRRAGSPNLRAASGARLIDGVDAHEPSTIERALAETAPDVVINAIGVVKQRPEARDPLRTIETNALFPHRLAAVCRTRAIRLIHISTDCVFSGRQGRYREDDLPDATDLYGRSKLLGEVEGPGVLTIRTSLIGHEIGSGHGLLEWFLAQRGEVRGFTRAVFSGVPTCELTRILADHVLPNSSLDGLYHISSAPISKYEVLGLIASAYGKVITIRPDDTPICDRSLVAERFHAVTGYVAPPWGELVSRMRADHPASSPDVGSPARGTDAAGAVR